MNGIELAIRRVSDRLKGRLPHDMGVTGALDELADEISRLSGEAIQALNATMLGMSAEEYERERAMADWQNSVHQQVTQREGK